MRRSIAGVIVMALGTCIIFQAGLPGTARGANFVYLEDFSDISYCDTLNTTALWDTLAGTVGLRYHGLSIAGSYPTPGAVWTVAVEGDVAYIIYWGGRLDRCTGRSGYHRSLGPLFSWKRPDSLLGAHIHG